MTIGTSHLLLMVGAFLAPYVLQFVTGLLTKSSGKPADPAPKLPDPAPLPDLASTHPLLNQLEPILLAIIQQAMLQLVQKVQVPAVPAVPAPVAPAQPH